MCGWTREAVGYVGRSVRMDVVCLSVYGEFYYASVRFSYHSAGRFDLFSLDGRRPLQAARVDVGQHGRSHSCLPCLPVLVTFSWHPFLNQNSHRRACFFSYLRLGHGCLMFLQEECEKFGSVKSVHIPRPSTMNMQEKPGVGFVFVAFVAVESSAKAAASLRARTFDGRKVCLIGVVSRCVAVGCSAAGIAGRLWL